MMHIFTRTKSLVLALAISTSCSLFSQSTEQDSSALLDFWVGNWEASWDEGEGKKGYGVNHIEKVLDGTVIQENFEILKGQSKGFKGTSISVFQTGTKEWKQSWADNQGGFYCFTGDLKGDKKTFQTATIETKDGKKITQRMVFYQITQDSMTWDWELSNDGGESWTLNWRINYKRKE
ncbi:hypothetical protein [Flagellimonas nanhaiensis]|uniref:DUF1579 domain-containing protein n=1 Tax=Flagellimonas nanhaiensis TaxID=2292706 RepID=A0A371JP80_9FLAO|nr:hypothetical protein [Allomuricauda nanhaiensis]RDY59315.1 hypothetical protein DX873_07920 [Allomuricauda nanhaiensis]